MVLNLSGESTLQWDMESAVPGNTYTYIRTRIHAYSQGRS